MKLKYCFFVGLERLGEGGWIMDIGEGMCYDEYCEVCMPDDSDLYPWGKYYIIC